MGRAVYPLRVGGWDGGVYRHVCVGCVRVWEGGEVLLGEGVLEGWG